MNKTLTAIIVGIIVFAAPISPELLSFSHAQSPASTAPAIPEIINTLDYFVSNHLDKGLTGSHNQNQTVVGNTSYYTKWSADAYEVHTWDDNYIYLNEDRSWKKDESYAFSPGKWMKRQMTIGESIIESNNMGYYVNSADCTPLRINALPYVMTLESHISNYDVGGNLGKQDVIVLKYDYSNTAYPGNFERFYYSKERGWVKWELYENNNLIQESIFNQIHNSPIQPDTTKSCTKSGTVLPAGSNIAGPALIIRLNQVVKLDGFAHMYYITLHAERQYICDARVLQRYGEAIKDIDTISQAELRAYPVLEYARFSGSNDVYHIKDQAIKKMTKKEIKQARLDVSALTVFNSLDFSCYQGG